MEGITHDLAALARTDPLTGFATRRGLLGDLDDAIGPSSRSSTLAIFDLGGFESYVELYGRLEGDALLARLAKRLSETLGPTATCYRTRDHEFSALLRGSPTITDPLLSAAAGEISTRFEQFGITLAFGAVTLPDDASDPGEAIALADTRLFFHARDRRPRERRRRSRERSADR